MYFIYYIQDVSIMQLCSYEVIERNTTVDELDTIISNIITTCASVNATGGTTNIEYFIRVYSPGHTFEYF